LQANIPDECIGKRATIHYKVYSYEEGQPWAAAVVQGTITEKNDLGILVKGTPTWSDAESSMLISYDALLSVAV
jgi:hypothetical protein